MDEAFLPFDDLLAGLLPELPDLYDVDAGVRTRITGYDVTTPVELDLTVAPDGTVRIGGAPPLYHLETSFVPVLHGIRIVAERAEATDD